MFFLNVFSPFSPWNRIVLERLDPGVPNYKAWIAFHLLSYFLTLPQYSASATQSCPKHTGCFPSIPKLFSLLPFILFYSLTAPLIPYEFGCDHLPIAMCSSIGFRRLFYELELFFTVQTQKSDSWNSDQLPISFQF